MDDFERVIRHTMSQDNLDQLLREQEEIDEEQQEEAQCAQDGPLFEEDNGPTVHKSGTSELMQESEWMDRIDNSNNMSRSLKWTCKGMNQASGPNDGDTKCFISNADGPMLSTKAKEQLMALNWVRFICGWWVIEMW